MKSFKEFINESKNYKQDIIKYNDIVLDDLVGLVPEDFHDFSDKGSFEYHNDIKDYYNKIIGIGGDLFYINDSGDYNRINEIAYDMKSGTYQYDKDISDRERKYGNKIPKSGSFSVIHGSPYGKIDKFDEDMFGKGYQKEELAHERFAGVYVSDNTNENKILNSGYGEVHQYHITFNNSIWEEDARKILIEYERKLGKRLGRISSTKFIRSLGYDMIYRKIEDSNSMEYIVIDVDKIK